MLSDEIRLTRAAARVGTLALLLAVACGGGDSERGSGSDDRDAGPAPDEFDNPGDDFNAGNPTAQPQVDAGALSPFVEGNCGLNCYSDDTGAGSEQPFDLSSTPNDGVGIDPDGALVLERQDADSQALIWIANTSEGSVSKIDTTTMTELGRYMIPGVDWNEMPEQNGPSRTSVDSAGDVYAGSRFGSGISKVSSAADACPDRNGDGIVTTSQGAMDLLNVGEDDCVVWTTDIGGDARGVAVQEIATQFEIEANPDGEPLIHEIPGDRFVWTGGRETEQVLKLDADNGDILLRLTTPPVPVYGLALDGRGNLWIASQRQSAFGRIDTTRCTEDECGGAAICTTVCSETSCPDTCDDAIIERIEVLKEDESGRKLSSYGVTVDCNQRVWLGGAHAGGGNVIGVKRYDPLAPANERLRMRLDIAGAETDGINGIAADAAGFVWGAAGNTGVVRIDAETLDFRVVTGTGGAEGNAKGIAVDRVGRVWAVPLRMDYAMVITPGPTIDDATLDVPITGFVGPYTYSDFSGEQRRLAANEPGSYRQLFEGCPAGSKPTEWGDLDWDVEVPDGTFVVFLGRTADSVDELEDAPWFNLAATPGRASPLPIAPFIRDANQEPGRYFEVEVRLFTTEVGSESGDGCTSSPAVTPRVKRFGIQYECEPDFG